MDMNLSNQGPLTAPLGDKKEPSQSFLERRAEVTSRWRDCVEKNGGFEALSEGIVVDGQKLDLDLVYQFFLLGCTADEKLILAGVDPETVAGNVAQIRKW
ncbi:hypothetical protein ACFL6C_07950 [Myxococcota bacterium]